MLSQALWPRLTLFPFDHGLDGFLGQFVDWSGESEDPQLDAEAGGGRWLVIARRKHQLVRLTDEPVNRYLLQSRLKESILISFQHRT